MEKDATYHRSAVQYNEGLAQAAEALAKTLEHPEIKKWCVSVGKQHRFHAKRHKSALEKIRAGEKVEDTNDVESEISHRDAGTGRYVTEEYADANPDTTVAEEQRRYAESQEGME